MSQASADSGVTAEGLAETAFSRTEAIEYINPPHPENSQALRDTASRREPTIDPTEPRHDVALGAWSVTVQAHGVVLRDRGTVVGPPNW